MIGFCGAHRTGKSTLAARLAGELGLVAVDTGLRHVWGELGLDPKADYPLEERIRIQHRMLDELERRYRSAPTAGFVADRTPICTAAYMLADVTRATTAAQSEAVMGYVDRCVQVTNRYFSTVFVVHPGIRVVDCGEGKGPDNAAYIEHLDMLIGGIAASKRCSAKFFSIPRGVLDLDMRMGAIHYALETESGRTQAELDGCLIH